jgi:hypothetical protein
MSGVERAHIGTEDQFVQLRKILFKPRVSIMILDMAIRNKRAVMMIDPILLNEAAQIQSDCNCFGPDCR